MALPQAERRLILATKKPIPKGRVTNSIRTRRLDAGLTQADLAMRVGATRQTLVAIEAGKYAPSLELAFRIARVFDCDFEDVFAFDPDVA